MTLRLATWNIAWMTRLYDADGAPHRPPPSEDTGYIPIAHQRAAVEAILPQLDADLLFIVEAPDDRPAGRTLATLERMATRIGLRARKGLIGFPNETGQELALLYDPDTVAVHHDPQASLAPPAPRFDTEFHIDLDIDDREDRVRFSKPPLEAIVTCKDGPPFRLIGVHVKSKAPHGAHTPEEVTQRAIANRRKQLAQCIWLRRRVEAHLNAGAPLVLLGDLNDGPGLDRYEALFQRSGVEIVLGHGEAPSRRLTDPHADAALAARLGAAPATARFYRPETGRYLSALLDYIFVSDAVLPARPSWRIWHPFDDARLFAEPERRSALLDASDHFPVTVDLSPSEIAG